MSKRFEKDLNKQRNTIIEILRDTKFDSFDVNLSYNQIIPFNTYSPWNDDLEFNNIYNLIKSHSLVDIYRCYELWEIVRKLNYLDGDILEVGVWKGGTAAIISSAASLNKQTKIYLADTFEGVPKASLFDPVYRGGEHSDTSELTVNQLLDSLQINNYTILKGIFPDDFTNFQIDKLKFCHIDVDTYLSAKDVFEYVWNNLIVGGVIIFDDYGFQTCEGVTKLFNELNLPNGHKIYNINGHGLIIKFQS